MARARRRVVVTWSLILCVTTLLVVGGSMAFWLRSRERPVAGMDATWSEDKVRVVSKFVSPGEDEALTFVQRALANRDPAQVTSFFRLGGASPAEVLEFLEGSAARDGRIDHCYWLSSMDVADLLLDGVLVVYAGKESICERVAFLTPDDKGVWKVDFEAFARTSRPAWKDLLERRVDQAQVRVFVTQEAYFNGPFLDDSQWVCVGMTSPESKQFLPDEHEQLQGYCRMGSPQAKAMEKLFGAGGQVTRMTLEIRRIEGAAARQFEVIRVLAEDWVLPAKPFDEKFT